jgi:hypothetical protein
MNQKIQELADEMKIRPSQSQINKANKELDVK